MRSGCLDHGNSPRFARSHVSTELGRVQRERGGSMAPRWRKISCAFYVKLRPLTSVGACDHRLGALDAERLGFADKALRGSAQPRRHGTGSTHPRPSRRGRRRPAVIFDDRSVTAGRLRRFTQPPQLQVLEHKLSAHQRLSELCFRLGHARRGQQIRQEMCCKKHLSSNVMR